MGVGVGLCVMCVCVCVCVCARAAVRKALALLLGNTWSRPLHVLCFIETTITLS